ncbi:helix-turn-helix domain-containing protein [Streptomyces sp. TRM43335]|uniref:Helix-turn-helix domain-containing protein n=1 Tax=Streptomyces taklimakanensis TaxID=2569853 RepID=A0A6G2BBQ9_9ACTN|nr:helix-turn-helix transcriptional regulator [Streptomyces taklimakanensis]MTE19509.1 helix-turn-helix domain-containing protein [Streptomyces taklimakanensis]
MAAAQDLEGFASWIEGLIRERGYDIDSPRGGGKSRLADAAGVHRAAITRLLRRHSMPDLETMRRLARVLRVPVREMLIRSGQLTAEELPPASAAQPPGEGADGTLTLRRAAELLGIPVEQREMFVRVAGQFLPEGGRPEVPARRRA